MRLYQIYQVFITRLISWLSSSLPSWIPLRTVLRPRTNVVSAPSDALETHSAGNLHFPGGLLSSKRKYGHLTILTLEMILFHQGLTINGWTESRGQKRSPGSRFVSSCGWWRTGRDLSDLPTVQKQLVFFRLFAVCCVHFVYLLSMGQSSVLSDRRSWLFRTVSPPCRSSRWPVDPFARRIEESKKSRRDLEMDWNGMVWHTKKHIRKWRTNNLLAWTWRNWGDVTLVSLFILQPFEASFYFFSECVFGRMYVTFKGLKVSLDTFWKVPITLPLLTTLIVPQFQVL